jgi:hypothetical protein
MNSNHINSQLKSSNPSRYVNRSHSCLNIGSDQTTLKKQPLNLEDRLSENQYADEAELIAFSQKVGELT